MEPNKKNQIEQTAAQIADDVQKITGSVAAAAATITRANLWTAIIGFFTALPGIIQLIQGFMRWVNAVSGNNPQAFISDLGKAISAVSNAKTKEEHENAAKNLSDLVHRLPS